MLPSLLLCLYPEQGSERHCQMADWSCSRRNRATWTLILSQPGPSRLSDSTDGSLERLPYSMKSCTQAESSSIQGDTGQVGRSLPVSWEVDNPLHRPESSEPEELR